MTASLGQGAPTSALPGHLARGVLPTRQLTSAESWKVWSEVYQAGNLKPHQLLGYRTVIAWRLTRLLACSQGRLSLNTRLSESLTEEDFEVPTKALQATAAVGPRPTRAFRALLSTGLALVPLNSFEHDTIFTEAIEILVRKFNMDRGSKDIPQLGEYGLHGLEHPSTVNEYWPSITAILSFEQQLIEEIQGLAIKWPRTKVISHLKDLLDVTSKEAGGLVALATQEAYLQSAVDVEVKRFLMEGRLEDYIERVQQAADPNNELRALKLLTLVQGLTKAETEGLAEEFVRAIASVAEAADQNGPLQITASVLEDDE